MKDQAALEEVLAFRQAARRSKAERIYERIPAGKQRQAGAPVA